MASRRKFLTILGGGVILAAGGASAFVATRTPTKALAPWEAAGGYDDPRMQALSYAILAPNPHNRQPWIVDLSKADEVTILRDKTRNLPETDPFDRQLTIGMGCFLEQMSIAASVTGHKVGFDLFPRGDDGPVAIARFATGGAKDPLFDHILNRRSCKEPFQDRVVTPTSELETLADIHTDPAKVSSLRELTKKAFEVETFTPHTLEESIHLMRIGKAEINANPDGIDLGGAFFETLHMAGMMSKAALMDTENVNFKQYHAGYLDMLDTTPAFAVIRTPGNTREDQIEAGRRWLRLNLTTTKLGLALHPVSQCLQEYPEMADHYAAAHDMLAKPGETVQMLGRLGNGPRTPFTPRWPLETRLLNG